MKWATASCLENAGAVRPAAAGREEEKWARLREHESPQQPGHAGDGQRRRDGIGFNREQVN